MSQQEQTPEMETLYLFRVKNEDGSWTYSAPRGAKALDAAIRASSQPGQVCLCYIVPDFDVDVEVRVPWGESRFEQSDTTVVGTGGSVNGSEVSQGENSTLRAKAAELSGGTGNGIEAGADEVLDSAGEDL